MRRLLPCDAFALQKNIEAPADSIAELNPYPSDPASMSNGNNDSEINRLQARLAELEAERDRLERRLDELREGKADIERDVLARMAEKRRAGYRALGYVEGA